MVQNSNGQPTRNTFRDKLLRIILFPLVIILYFPMKLIDFFSKSKNCRKYKNAAYLTLNSKNYKPCFSDLYYCFRAGGLSKTDSIFNAVYMLCSEKLYRNDSPKAEKGIFEHPAGWSESENAKIERCADAFSLRLLTVVSQILSFPAHFASKINLKKAVQLFAPAAVAVAVFCIISLSSQSTVVINAYIDNEYVGSLAQMENISDTVNKLESDMSTILGEEYKYPFEITYEITEENNPEFTGNYALYNTLFSYTSDVSLAAGLYIDGELVAVCENVDAASDALNNVLECYKEKSGKSSVSISDNVRILEQYYPSCDIVDAESFISLFNTEFDYVSSAESVCADPVLVMSIGENGVNGTVGGRSLRDIPTAQGHEAPLLDSKYLAEAELVEVPFETSQVVTYRVDIPFDSVVKEDNTRYSYYSAIAQRGAEGRAEITAEIVYINGLESERIILSEKIAIEPIDQITVVGVKPYPEDLGLDSKKIFIFPHEGYISDYFGGRILRGSYNYHRGIDIPGAKGTPIYASASGTVIVSEYNGAYGNHVVIDHGDGLTSYYAHMSKLIAAEGDAVKQGDMIGLIGSTGDSTGNHVHFEIRKDGTHVDPMKYIYQE